MIKNRKNRKEIKEKQKERLDGTGGIELLERGGGGSGQVVGCGVEEVEYREKAGLQMCIL